MWSHGLPLSPPEQAGPDLGRPCRRPRAHPAVSPSRSSSWAALTDGGRRGFPAQARAPILGRRPADPRPGSTTRDPPRPRGSLGCGAGRGRGRERDRYGRRPAGVHQPVDRVRGLAHRPGVPRTGTPRHGHRAPGRGACRPSRSDPAHAAGGLAAHVPGRFRADAAAVHRPRAGIHAHRGGFGDVHPRVLAAGERRLDGDRCRRRVRLAGALALQIGYLPALYSAYNRRENSVALLNARAGVPTWGPELLARTHYGLGTGTSTVGTLPDLYAEWERWAADVTESHRTYLPLIYFRSHRALSSWVTA